MQKMSFCNSDQKSMLIGGFLACNDSDIVCRPKLIHIGRLDTELISCLQCLHSIKKLTSNGIPNGGVIPLSRVVALCPLAPVLLGCISKGSMRPTLTCMESETEFYLNPFASHCNYDLYA